MGFFCVTTTEVLRTFNILRWGLTTGRRCRRYATSIISVSCCKTRNGGNYAIKTSQFLGYRNFCVTEDPLVCIESSCTCLHWKLLPRPTLTLHVVVCTGAVVNMHPSHLGLDSLSRTDMINPFGVCNCDGGWACFVRAFVFSAFSCNPMPFTYRKRVSGDQLQNTQLKKRFETNSTVTIDTSFLYVFVT